MPLTTIGGSRITIATIPEDRLINPYVNVGGDTMTGTLTLPSNGLVVGGNQLYVTSSGGNVRIGVGTNNPTSALHVIGTIQADNINVTNPISYNSLILSYGSATTASISFTGESTGLFRPSTGILGFVSSGSTVLTTSSTELLNYTGKYSYIRNSVSESAISYYQPTDTLYFGSGTSNISFGTFGSFDRIYINSNGNVGIKTSNIDPYALSVSGRVYSTNGYAGIKITDIPGVSSNPSNGQILIGNGTSAWSVGNITAGTGISITNTFGQIQIGLGIGITSNIGVASISGTVNQIYANNSTGDVILTLPQDININSNVLFNSVKVDNATLSTSEFVTNSLSQVAIDEYISTSFRTAKYIIQIKNTDNSYYETSELLVTHNGSLAYVTQYAIISTGPTYLSSFDADIYPEVFGLAVRLLLTPTYPNNKIRIQRTLLDIFD